ETRCAICVNRCQGVMPDRTRPLGQWCRAPRRDTTSPMETPRLGIAMAGLDSERLGLNPTAPHETRALIDWARASGFAAVQLNAAAPGIRPRDLDRSGRRDLA